MAENVWSGKEPIATNRKDEQIRFRMRHRDVVVKQVELSWGGTNHDELQGHTTTCKTELLAMHNDAVRQKTDEVDMQRVHSARLRIGTT